MSSSEAKKESTSPFRHALPLSRLGQSHDTIAAFQEATAPFQPTTPKVYSLIVITEPQKERILLGLKQRGFGKGMYNSFGGKIEENEHVVDGAVRELHEETGIQVTLEHMTKCRMGVLRFTFCDQETEMIAHLFRVNVTIRSTAGDPALVPIDPSVVRPCEEIVPQWWASWYDIPLQNMFADDSLWLTRMLTTPNDKMWIEGHFHFEPGGQEVNTIRHYHLTFKRSLEQELFHQLHACRIHNPSIKEFKESFAFGRAVQAFFKRSDFEVVVDVAGGHGALAALLLTMLPSVQEAVVVDPANVATGCVQRAWGDFYETKTLRYRHECLRTGLPGELTRLQNRKVLVVACHACQHLSEETLAIACRFGVAAAVMPCCQKDTSPGSSWKSTSKNLGIPIEKVMDILLAGKAMSWRNTTHEYDVRIKLIDQTITPQNRIILCRRLEDTNESSDEAHAKLERAYRKAHQNSQQYQKFDWISKNLCPKSMLIGMVVGLTISWAMGRLR